MDHADRADGQHAIASSIRVACWFIVALGAVALLHAADSFFIPVCMGIVLAYALRPFVDTLARIRLPRPIASFLVTLTFVGLGALAAYSLADDATQLLDEMPRAARKVRVALQEMQSDKSGALQQVREAAREIGRVAEEVTGNTPVPAARKEPARDVSRELGDMLMAQGYSMAAVFWQSLFALLLASYLLAEGTGFRRRLMRAVGPSLADRLVTTRILDDIDTQVQRYVMATLATSALFGLAITLAFLALGMEHPVLWGVAAASLHLVPYIGQIVFTGVSSLAAFIQFGSATQAAVVGAVGIVADLIVGTLLMTWLQSRVSRTNPAAVFIALLFFGWLWGAWGLVLASPIMAVVKSLCDHVPAFAPGAALLSRGDPPLPLPRDAPADAGPRAG
jgi:predicted PurR-regulated permease PerM